MERRFESRFAALSRPRSGVALFFGKEEVKGPIPFVGFFDGTQSFGADGGSGKPRKHKQNLIVLRKPDGRLPSGFFGSRQGHRIMREGSGRGCAFGRRLAASCRGHERGIIPRGHNRILLKREASGTLFCHIAECAISQKLDRGHAVEVKLRVISLAR